MVAHNNHKNTHLKKGQQSFLMSYRTLKWLVYGRGGLVSYGHNFSYLLIWRNRSWVFNSIGLIWVPRICVSMLLGKMLFTMDNFTCSHSHCVIFCSFLPSSTSVAKG